MALNGSAIKFRLSILSTRMGIYVVDTVSRMAHAGVGADCLAYRVYDEIFGRLGVSETDVKELMTEFNLKLNIAEKLFHSI
ncbi:hypothetical protein [uncultured Desulfosarcina sp.]|uniref:hypothetical protein n=1 Tax=uncultured Desulfosarcina sp. TaxID=218289 RepID=UPI003749CD99